MHHTLEVKGLHYTYPNGTTALRGLDLYVAPDERVALVGPNGSGKSTLLLHLNGILQGEGLVLVAGKEVNTANRMYVRAHVGMVFQDPNDQLFSQTVFEDVAFGPRYMGIPPTEIPERVQASLTDVGMPSAGERTPYHMSHGEKKRVALATVLVMDPEILVLDEPTAGLDPGGRRDLIGLLSELPQTMLVATHDMRMVAEAFPRVVVMDEGRIIKDGPTHEILRDEAFLLEHGLEAP